MISCYLSFVFLTFVYATISSTVVSSTTATTTAATTTASTTVATTSSITFSYFDICQHICKSIPSCLVKGTYCKINNVCHGLIHKVDGKYCYIGDNWCLDDVALDNHPVKCQASFTTTVLATDPTTNSTTNAIKTTATINVAPTTTTSITVSPITDTTISQITTSTTSSSTVVTTDSTTVATISSTVSPTTSSSTVVTTTASTTVASTSSFTFTYFDICQKLCKSIPSCLVNGTYCKINNVCHGLIHKVNGEYCYIGDNGCLDDVAFDNHPVKCHASSTTTVLTTDPTTNSATNVIKTTATINVAPTTSTTFATTKSLRHFDHCQHICKSIPSCLVNGTYCKINNVCHGLSHKVNGKYCYIGDNECSDDVAFGYSPVIC